LKGGVNLVIHGTFSTSKLNWYCFASKDSKVFIFPKGTFGLCWCKPTGENLGYPTLYVRSFYPSVLTFTPGGCRQRGGGWRKIVLEENRGVLRVLSDVKGGRALRGRMDLSQCDRGPKKSILPQKKKVKHSLSGRVHFFSFPD
jgi:hypothetical protein